MRHLSARKVPCRLATVTFCQIGCRTNIRGQDRRASITVIALGNSRSLKLRSKAVGGLLRFGLGRRAAEGPDFHPTQPFAVAPMNDRFGKTVPLV